jgi:Uma2 family endonuclease
MATTTNLLSWAAFEQLPDDGMHREVIQGELIILPPPKWKHSDVARRANRALLSLEDHGLGDVYVEAGYKLSDNPPTWIQPDVSFLRAERVRASKQDGYLTGAPDLAIEIVSPSESARDLKRKVEALLAAGGQQIWVVYPESRRVNVFLRDGTSRIFRASDSLSLPDLLPGWELPVAKLFED